MCFVQSKDPEPIQQPATIADPQVQQAGDDAKKRARAAAGSQSTILSSLFNVPTAVGGGAKTLLGQ
jgi:hypothetical protein